MKQNRFNQALLAAAALVLPMAAWSSDLELKVENVKGASGDLRVAVYGSSADYRKSAVREIKVAAVGDPVSIPISGLAAGDYAIALYHDRNGNQKLDSNLMGIPTEPYGFSGSSRDLMGPATWEQARFAVGSDRATVTVRLSD
jgi:uncharacterized protein (DUF2141 family)